MSNSFIFITQVVPKAEVSKLKLSQAANNFCFRVAEACDCYHISIVPISIKRILNCNREDDCVYFQVRKYVHRGITKWLNVLIENILVFRHVRQRKEINIWLYNIILPNIILFFLLKYFTKKHVHVLLADYNPSRYPWILKKLILLALQKCDGIISLSGRCKIKGQRILNIPGIYPQSEISKSVGKFYGNHKFLLSGTINKNTGLDLALKTFKGIKEAELYISGTTGTSESLLIKQYENEYPNIHYLGMLPSYTSYLNLLNEVDFVLSLRDPKEEVNLYNFPSKIIETLAHNRPVISTIDYVELKGLNYFICNYNIEALSELVRKLLVIDKESMKPYLDNYEILSKRSSEIAWRDGFNRMNNEV